MTHIFPEGLDEPGLRRTIKPWKYNNILADLHLLPEHDNGPLWIEAQTHHLDAISCDWARSLHRMRGLLPDTPQQRDRHHFRQGGAL